MSIRIPESLYLPYDEISHFLEKIPNGMAYDIMLQKVPSLRWLKKKEIALLLKYIESKDRIVVIKTTTHGKPSSPLLRHKMHSENLTVVEQPDKVIPDNVVYSATPGRITLAPENKVIPTHPVIKEEPVEKPVIPEKIETDPKALRNLHLKDLPLIKAAENIIKSLLSYSNGLTRTELSNKVVQYHHLRGMDRDIVLSYLVAREGVILSKVSPSGQPIVAGRYIHPTHVKPLDICQQRFDHEKPTVSLDPVMPLRETLKLNKIPPAVSTPRENILSLLGKGKGYLPVFRLVDYIPNFAALFAEEREALLNELVTEDILDVYDYIHPNIDTTIQWVALKGKMPLSHFNSITKELTPPTEKEKEVEKLPESNKSFDSAEEVRKQIKALENIAKELEEKEKNGALIESIKPLRDQIVKQFTVAQEALNKQIDAHAELEIVIGKLNKILDL